MNIADIGTTVQSYARTIQSDPHRLTLVAVAIVLIVLAVALPVILGGRRKSGKSPAPMSFASSGNTKVVEVGSTQSKKSTITSDDDYDPLNLPTNQSKRENEKQEKIQNNKKKSNNTESEASWENPEPAQEKTGIAGIFSKLIKKKQPKVQTTPTAEPESTENWKEPGTRTELRMHDASGATLPYVPGQRRADDPESNKFDEFDFDSPAPAPKQSNTNNDQVKISTSALSAGAAVDDLDNLEFDDVPGNDGRTASNHIPPIINRRNERSQSLWDDDSDIRTDGEVQNLSDHDINIDLDEKSDSSIKNHNEEDFESDDFDISTDVDPANPHTTNHYNSREAPQTEQDIEFEDIDVTSEDANVHPLTSHDKALHHVEIPPMTFAKEDDDEYPRNDGSWDTTNSTQQKNIDDNDTQGPKGSEKSKEVPRANEPDEHVGSLGLSDESMRKLERDAANASASGEARALEPGHLTEVTREDEFDVQSEIETSVGTTIQQAKKWPLYVGGTAGLGESERANLIRLIGSLDDEESYLQPLINALEEEDSNGLRPLVLRTLAENYNVARMKPIYAWLMESGNAEEKEICAIGSASISE